jgi:uncharacterized protein (DUF952 family)
MATHILHIVPAGYYHAQPADRPYLPEAYPADGFIHCTREPEVMLQIANRFYRTAAGDVLVLVIDADRVGAPVKWEPPVHPDGAPAQPGERLFPHIYGPLNRDAIVAIRTARRAEDGSFLAV